MPLTIALPQFADLMIEDVTVEEGTVTVEARVAGADGICPACGTASRRIHSRYWRTIADAPLADCRATFRLLVRRFRCAAAACSRVTFAEQVPRLVAPHARRSLALRALHARLRLALSGRPGMRLSDPLRLPIGRMTLLRAVRALPDPPAPTPRVLGVDDFALARGRRYGTILIDLEMGLPPFHGSSAISVILLESADKVGIAVRFRSLHATWRAVLARFWFFRTACRAPFTLIAEEPIPRTSDHRVLEPEEVTDAAYPPPLPAGVPSRGGAPRPE